MAKKLANGDSRVKKWEKQWCQAVSSSAWHVSWAVEPGHGYIMRMNSASTTITMIMNGNCTCILKIQ